MTDEKRKEALRKLRSLQKMHDTEIAHVNADEVLLDVLIHLGEDKIVHEYDKIDKWYA